MNITPKQIAHVLDLDSKRTQGEWRVEFGRASDDVSVLDTGGCPIAYLVHDRDDALFIAAAPLMAQIIRHQQEQLRVAREALEIVDRTIQARALILVGSAYHDIIKQTLSLINNSTTTKE